MSWHLEPDAVRVAVPADEDVPHLWGVSVACRNDQEERTAYCFIGRASLLSHEPESLAWEPARLAQRIQEIACVEVQRHLDQGDDDALVLFL